MTEQQIQSKVIKRLENDGWYVIKLIKTNKNGIPDLLAIKPPFVKFIEVKKPKTGILSKLQEYRINELKQFGINTIVSISEEDL